MKRNFNSFKEYILPTMAINLANKKFGRLLVLFPMKKKNVENSKQGIYWMCNCDCGQKTIINGHSLKSGLTKSCGCIVRELTIKRNKELCGEKSPVFIDGLSNTKEHRQNKLLQRRYGITLEKYNELYKTQKGSCLICDKNNIKLAIDHNHNNNKIRGLVCYNCNYLISVFEQYKKITKNRILFNKIEDYLNKGD
jgi:hypothetical protein